MVLARLMDGVRRWIRSSPASNRHSKRTESYQDPESPTEQENDPVYQYSTEYIARRLMDPIVLPEEKVEYQELAHIICAARPLSQH